MLPTPERTCALPQIPDLPRSARCVLYYNTILPKGGSDAAPLLDTPGFIGAARHRAGSAPRKRIAVSSLASVWPLHRHSRERPCSPENPTAISLRPGRILSPLDPIEQGYAPCTAPWFRPWRRPKSLHALWKPDQPCADWMRASVSPLDCEQRVHPLHTKRAQKANFHSTQ